MTDCVFRVLSLGAGVQSTALLMMAKEGRLRADVAVFADTGWEPVGVYEHLWNLGAITPIPLHIVSNGNLHDDQISGDRAASLPYFTDTGDVEWSPTKGWRKIEGKAWRQCTKEYKLEPIYSFIDDVRAGRDVEVLVGISLDEWQRIKPSHVEWATRVHPLIEMQWTRGDCERYLADVWNMTAPRSSCIGCPLHGDTEWLQRTDEEIAALAEWEPKMQAASALKQTPYLHRSLLPIGEAVAEIRAGRLAAPAVWDEECEGACGV